MRRSSCLHKNLENENPVTVSAVDHHLYNPVATTSYPDSPPIPAADLYMGMLLAWCHKQIVERVDDNPLLLFEILNVVLLNVVEIVDYQIQLPLHRRSSQPEVPLHLTNLRGSCCPSCSSPFIEDLSFSLEGRNELRSGAGRDDERRGGGEGTREAGAVGESTSHFSSASVGEENVVETESGEEEGWALVGGQRQVMSAEVGREGTGQHSGEDRERPAGSSETHNNVSSIFTGMFSLAGLFRRRHSNSSHFTTRTETQARGGRGRSITQLPVEADRGGGRSWTQLRYRQAMRGSDAPEEECNICHEDYEDSSMVLVLPCDHFWHTACIRKWLGRSESCPVCREEFPGMNGSIRSGLEGGGLNQRGTGTGLREQSSSAAASSSSSSAAAARWGGRDGQGGVSSSSSSGDAAAVSSSYFSSASTALRQRGLSALAAHERVSRRERDSLASFYQRYQRRDNTDTAGTDLDGSSRQPLPQAPAVGGDDDDELVGARMEENLREGSPPSSIRPFPPTPHPYPQSPHPFSPTPHPYPPTRFFPFSSSQTGLHVPSASPFLPPSPQIPLPSPLPPQREDEGPPGRSSALTLGPSEREGGRKAERERLRRQTEWRMKMEEDERKTLMRLRITSLPPSHSIQRDAQLLNSASPPSVSVRPPFSSSNLPLAPPDRPSPPSSALSVRPPFSSSNLPLAPPDRPSPPSSAVRLTTTETALHSEEAEREGGDRLPLPLPLSRPHERHPMNARVAVRSPPAPVRRDRQGWDPQEVLRLWNLSESPSRPPAYPLHRSPRETAPPPQQNASSSFPSSTRLSHLGGLLNPSPPRLSVDTTGRTGSAVQPLTKAEREKRKVKNRRMTNEEVRELVRKKSTEERDTPPFIRPEAPAINSVTEWPSDPKPLTNSSLLPAPHEPSSSSASVCASAVTVHDRSSVCASVIHSATLLPDGPAPPPLGRRVIEERRSMRAQSLGDSAEIVERAQPDSATTRMEAGEVEREPNVRAQFPPFPFRDRQGGWNADEILRLWNSSESPGRSPLQSRRETRPVHENLSSSSSSSSSFAFLEVNFPSFHHLAPSSSPSCVHARGNAALQPVTKAEREMRKVKNRRLTEEEVRSLGTKSEGRLPPHAGLAGPVNVTPVSPTDREPLGSLSAPHAPPEPSSSSAPACASAAEHNSVTPLGAPEGSSGVPLCSGGHFIEGGRSLVETVGDYREMFDFDGMEVAAERGAGRESLNQLRRREGTFNVTGLLRGKVSAERGGSLQVDGGTFEADLSLSGCQTERSPVRPSPVSEQTPFSVLLHQYVSRPSGGDSMRCCHVEGAVMPKCGMAEAEVLLKNVSWPSRPPFNLVPAADLSEFVIGSSEQPLTARGTSVQTISKAEREKRKVKNRGMTGEELKGLGEKLRAGVERPPCAPTHDSASSSSSSSSSCTWGAVPPGDVRGAPPPLPPPRPLPPPPAGAE
uniref:RING-type domain-containing protein n=1 Tax=Chromera velia CCMP2878 TaxID=1169474 RepID=A0A0G4F9D3_9ALVE|eukprot:Cvel_2992.t1-p1 / transcript=Cvel_2992.t1 / gene=Cvel_2992 / organism=Chromera_velia_CCMP2878 / gene_product=E3 ubiquitin-protein ligase RNF181, putative / transcript_product=E3 ubiquitin-protein ligase RNF181, putative / location=Cvel_scaffold119:30773-41195(-) / protein_length=1445 / sequence_SO=supercontig / SO=protein_coding / is_pseudo=false